MPPLSVKLCGELRSTRSSVALYEAVVGLMLLVFWLLPPTSPPGGFLGLLTHPQLPMVIACVTHNLLPCVATSCDGDRLSIESTESI